MRIALAVLPGKSGTARGHLAGILALTLTSACAYEHETWVRVKDPRAVWLEAGDSRNVTAATRDADGALSVGGHTVVDASGEVRGTQTPDDVAFRGDDARIRVWYGRRMGTSRWLATPASNLRLVRHGDEPIRGLGAGELILGGGLIAGGFVARSPTTSGSSILFGLGAIAAVVGLLQLVAPAKNVETLAGP